MSGSGSGAAPRTMRRARLASWRAASGERSRISAISENGTANMSCRTNASRSTGVSVSRTTSSAMPTESASTACSSGPSSTRTIGSGVNSSSACSRRARRTRSSSRQTRATPVVSQPPRFATASASERPRRNHASCTASSASVREPSIRYATRVRWSRCSSKRSARSVMSHPFIVIRHEIDEPNERDVTGGTMIEVDHLTKVYPGGVEAVRGISFTVEPGEVFGLLGPNGAGKSTTIGMLTTTVMPTSGSARLAGHDVATDPLAARSVSSVVFQEPVVDRPLTGRRNLELHASLRRTPRPRLDELAIAFGLEDLLDRPVESYSGGQRRRLEIARALLSEPEVLFLDEPTVGLDPRIRHELLDVIAGLRNRGNLTLLLTTHYLDEAERLCDRVGIMHAGRI